MATIELSACNGWCMSQLKIILLGGRNSGKSSVGNLLLGKEEFVTKERTCCSRRVGVVAGRWLTVVDTPGWWCDLSARDTSQLVKRDIVSSVSLCAAGPHVFVIVVKASSVFTEQRRRAVEEHVQLLGDAVWSHCFLVFTFNDKCNLREAEEHVQRGGQALQWLYDKCGQRCHSLVINDDTGVTQLLLKIQRLVTTNGNLEFQIQGHILQMISEDKRRIEEKAQQRFMKMKEQRALMRERLKAITEIRIVLLGAKGSGKTSVFNTILGKKDSHSGTRTARCNVGEAVVFGRLVTVVDTPGWWSNYFCDESPIFDKREMVLSLSLCNPGPHAFLLVIRVDRAFTETYRRAVEEHIEFLSGHIWSRFIVLFSFGDWLGSTPTEQYIESESEPLQWIVDRCCNRYHVLNNKTKGDGFQVRELVGKIEEMVAGCGSNRYFEIESSLIKNLEQRVKEEMNRGEERRMLKERQRQMAKTHLENLTLLSDLRLVLIGGRKTGKSSCGNTILGRDCFETETQTTSCIEKQSNVNGKTVSVLDTPSSFSVTSDLLSTLSPCAFLLVVNVSSVFKDVHLKAVEDQLDAGGSQIWSRAMVLFSFGDWLGDTNIEQRIESEGHLLQRLVMRCGNRYHVLDNKNRACKAQVNELIEFIDEMMVEERRVMFGRGDHMSRRLPEQQQLEALCKSDLLSHDLAESASAMPSLISAAAAGPIVALSAGRSGQQSGLRDRGSNSLASVLNGKNRLWWTEAGQMLRMNLPIRLLGEDLHTNLRLHNERQVHLLSSRNSTTVLYLPQAQGRMLTGENVNRVHSLCHPALIDRTLRRLTECGGLQALIDQWGDSSLEELEAFIDLYFEMVWDRTMGPCSQEAELDTQSRDQEQSEEEVLSTICKKLSKLDLLQEIREDLVELRKSLEQSMKAIEELRGKAKHDSE